MEEKKEFYCPKIYGMCDRALQFVEMVGINKTHMYFPACHTMDSKCKFTIHQKMMKALEKCADAS